MKNNKSKKIMLVLFLSMAAVSFASCSMKSNAAEISAESGAESLKPDAKDMPKNRLMGKITAITDSTLTIETGHFGPMGSDSKDSEHMAPPEKPENSSGNENMTPPEKPENSSGNENMTPPEKPDGNAPEKNDAGTKESESLTLSASSSILQGFQAGDMVEIVLDDTDSSVIKEIKALEEMKKPSEAAVSES